MPSAVATVILLAAALLAACGLLLHSLAMMLLRPPRMTDGKAMYVMRRMSPGDLGLPFEPIDFTSRTAAGKPIRIASWWIPAQTSTPAASDRTCVLVHGFGDAKVGALAWAPLWRSLGWNLLLVDLRAHGESQGTNCTGGFFERDDVDAVIDSIRALKPDATRRIALFGVSLGGAVVLATAARRDDIDAVIADAVFADYRRAAVVHGRIIGAPLTHLTPLAIRWGERMAGARFDDVRPLDTICAARCPVMLIHGDADPFVVDADVIALTTALRTRGDGERDVHLIVPGAGHCMAIVADGEAYASKLEAFLRTAITNPPS